MVSSPFSNLTLNTGKMGDCIEVSFSITRAFSDRPVGWGGSMAIIQKIAITIMITGSQRKRNRLERVRSVSLFFACFVFLAAMF